MYIYPQIYSYIKQDAEKYLVSRVARLPNQTSFNWHTRRMRNGLRKFDQERVAPSSPGPSTAADWGEH